MGLKSCTLRFYVSLASSLQLFEVILDEYAFILFLKYKKYFLKNIQGNPGLLEIHNNHNIYQNSKVHLDGNTTPNIQRQNTLYALL
jgi:hypothetical protein